MANDSTGWGLRDESYTVFEKIRQLNGPDWFKLGDKDLATHITRSHKMEFGETLTQITHDFCELWGIDHNILPMTDDPVRTFVETMDDGLLPFQEYFVKNHFEPRIKGFIFQGIETAHPTEEVIKVY